MAVAGSRARLRRRVLARLLRMLVVVIVGGCLLCYLRLCLRHLRRLRLLEVTAGLWVRFYMVLALGLVHMLAGMPVVERVVERVVRIRVWLLDLDRRGRIR